HVGGHPEQPLDGGDDAEGANVVAGRLSGLGWCVLCRRPHEEAFAPYAGGRCSRGSWSLSPCFWACWNCCWRRSSSRIRWESLSVRLPCLGGSLAVICLSRRCS